MNNILKIPVSGLLRFLSFLILLASLIFIVSIWWQTLVVWYLHLTHPVGGDFYTGLTYAVQIAKHVSLPPAGWFSFWNAGTPIVGGYQWLIFYLIVPLIPIFGVYKALDVISLGSILLYFLFAHLLFWQITKNHLISLGLTLINLTSQAVYYQLIIGGMITGSTMQFYLPLSLFFLYRFFESPYRMRAFMATGIVNAISIIHHPALGILFVVLPTVTTFIIKEFTSKTQKHIIIYRFLKYILSLFSVGAIGIFPFLFSMSLTETASKCDNPQCWGIYPYHIERWLGWLPIWLVIISLLLTLGVVVMRKIFGHRTSIKFLAGPAVALIISILYPVAAYFHMIPSLANSIFPRRMFWVILLMILVFNAHVYILIHRSARLAGWTLSIVFIVVLSLVLPLRIKSNFKIELSPPHTGDIPNTVPNYIHQWIIPKYAKNEPVTSFLPDWILKGDANYRFDSLNSAVTHWWNLISAIPATRGYTSSFNSRQLVWAHFLQTSLNRQQPDTYTTKILVNRIKFLLDAYAIKYAYLQDYHPDILTKEYVLRTQNNFAEFSNDVSTPIIYPTLSPAMLFIGDDSGYDTFIRSLADINFNSRLVIPVKGPVNLDSLDQKTLEQFPVLFLYRFEGNPEKLKVYLKNGGTVFVDLGSLTKTPKNISEILPYSKYEIVETTEWNLDAKTSQIFDNVDIKSFAPLRYQGNPWKLVVSKPENLKNGSEVLLVQDSQVLISLFVSGKGKVIVSGINLPYHLNEYHNENEAILYSNLLTNLLPRAQSQPEARSIRMTPEEISIVGKNMSGIYFKENFHPGWESEINNSRTKIYPAGLNFMYIPTPQGTNTVKLKFKGNKTVWALFYISLASLVLSLLIIINPKYFAKVFHPVLAVIRHLFFRATRRWQSDEQDKY